MSAFCNCTDVRNIISLTATDISDSSITNLINIVSIEIAQELYTYYEDEKIEYIDSEKDNDIDGSNTIYYTKFWPLADRNQDGDVDKTDVKVYKFDTNGNRTEMTVSSIDASKGKITLSEAPTTDYTLKVTYASIPPNITANDLKLACMLLTAGYCYIKVEPTFLKHFDTLDVIRMPEPADRYFNRYKELMKKIKSEIGRKVKDTETVTFEDLRGKLPLREW